MKHYLLFFYILFSNLFMLEAQIEDDSIPPGKNFNKALFRLWYPEDIDEIKGLITITPGYNIDGRDLVNDTLWQNLAKRHDFALLGVFFTDYERDGLRVEDMYLNMENGSGTALLKAISQLAKKTRHKELKKVPLLLWGFSVGGAI